MASRDNSNPNVGAVSGMDQQENRDATDVPGFMDIPKRISKAAHDFVLGSSDEEDMETDELSKFEILKDDEYNFAHSKRGIAVIIINDSFEQFAQRRAGSEHDRDKLYDCFHSLGFEIIPLQNCDSVTMIAELNKVVAKMNGDRDFDCFVFAISSHGDYQEQYTDNKTIKEDILFTTNGFIATEQVIEMFDDINCPGLKDKPRLFFIQACRGNKLDPGFHPDDPQRFYNKLTYYSDREVITKIPCRKDFLVMYATPPGFYAFRKRSEGSWFVIELCRILKMAQGKKTNLCRYLRWVTKSVTVKYESNTLPSHPDQHEKRQTPCIHSMLVKDIHLGKKN